MHIVISRIGFEGDYSSLTSWEAARRNEPHLFNVGVALPPLVDQTEYERFLQDVRFDKSHFVLMTDDGIVLASRITGQLRKVCATFPPTEPSPFGSFDDEVVGHGNENNIEEIARNYIERTLDEFDQDLNRSEVQRIIQTCTRQIAESIAKDPRALMEIEWRDLERVLAEALQGIGFSARLTPPSKDGGKDIVLECTPNVSSARTYLVEVKHWRSKQKVGTETISEFCRVVVRERAHGGLFLSTSGVTGNAIERLTDFERRTVRIGGESKVVALCRSYVKSAGGVVVPSTELPDILFSETID